MKTLISGWIYFKGLLLKTVFGYLYKHGGEKLFFKWGEIHIAESYEFACYRVAAGKGLYCDYEPSRLVIWLGKYYITIPLEQIEPVEEVDSCLDKGWTGFWFKPFSDRQLSIYRGSKRTITINMPWSRHFLSFGNLVETKTGWLFRDRYDGKLIPCNLTRTVSYYTWVGLKWIPWLRKGRHSLELDFLGVEVGPEKGSWKGGTLKCNTRVSKNQSTFEAFKEVEDRYL